jgi:mono/diheme cytochrome c family protein
MTIDGRGGVLGARPGAAGDPVVWADAMHANNKVGARKRCLTMSHSIYPLGPPVCNKLVRPFTCCVYGMKLPRWGIIPVLAGVLGAYGQTPSPPQDGRWIYRHKCGGCHGLDGKGQTTMGKEEKMRDLTSAEVQSQTDTEMIRVIANGRGRMPAYQLILGDERMQDVVAYIRELGKK